MVEISVKEMVRASMKHKVYVTLPEPRTIKKIQDRIDYICECFQRDAITRKLPFPQKEWKELGLEFANESSSEENLTPKNKRNLKKIMVYNRKYEELLEKGVGRQKLVKYLPDYKDEKKILEILKTKYYANPSEAGIYAQHYLAFNPFTNFYESFHRDLDEPFGRLKIPHSQDIILYQYDLLDLRCIYEFKLTHKKILGKRLREALIQCYIYNFLYIMEMPTRFILPIIIDICVIDEEKIYSYGDLTGKNVIYVDKEKLKLIFQSNHFSNLEFIDKMIDDIYDNPSYRKKWDSWRFLYRLKNR